MTLHAVLREDLPDVTRKSAQLISPTPAGQPAQHDHAAQQYQAVTHKDPARITPTLPHDAIQVDIPRYAMISRIASP